MSLKSLSCLCYFFLETHSQEAHYSPSPSHCLTITTPSQTFTLSHLTHTKWPHPTFADPGFSCLASSNTASSLVNFKNTWCWLETTPYIKSATPIRSLIAVIVLLFIYVYSLTGKSIYLNIWATLWGSSPAGSIVNLCWFKRSTIKFPQYLTPSSPTHTSNNAHMSMNGKHDSRYTAESYNYSHFSFNGNIWRNGWYLSDDTILQYMQAYIELAAFIPSTVSKNYKKVNNYRLLYVLTLHMI